MLVSEIEGNWGTHLVIVPRRSPRPVHARVFVVVVVWPRKRVIIPSLHQRRLERRCAWQRGVSRREVELTVRREETNEKSLAAWSVRAAANAGCFKLSSASSRLSCSSPLLSSHLPLPMHHVALVQRAPTTPCHSQLTTS